MDDSIRENLSYYGIYKKLLTVKKEYTPEHISYGEDRDQYFLYYEPRVILSDKVIFWIHGGGWNSGSPKFFDYVGQCMANEGYRMISIGYRLAPWHKYPCQIMDVCDAYNAAKAFLRERDIDVSKIVVAGPSAGAHLGSILCYCRKVQERFDVDISNVIGFIGSGGPYSFREGQSGMVDILLNQLFKKDYNRRNGEPVALMSKNHIPMLLIQSRHDGLVDYECAEEFAKKAEEVGNTCELYSVTDEKNTHSWYTAGMFLETREENMGLDKFFSWIEEL